MPDRANEDTLSIFMHVYVRGMRVYKTFLKREIWHPIDYNQILSAINGNSHSTVNGLLMQQK